MGTRLTEHPTLKLPRTFHRKKLSSGTLDDPSGVFASNFEEEFENLSFSYLIKCGCIRRRN